MKRIVIVFLLISMLFCFVSCKQKNENNKIPEEVQKDIKEIYLNFNNTNTKRKKIESSQIEIKYYLGDYNGKKCAYIKNDISEYNGSRGTIRVYTVSVDGCDLYMKDIPETISVYYEGDYYTLIDACKAGLFSYNELKEIQNYCLDRNIWIKL